MLFYHLLLSAKVNSLVVAPIRGFSVSRGTNCVFENAETRPGNSIADSEHAPYQFLANRFGWRQRNFDSGGY